MMPQLYKSMESHRGDMNFIPCMQEIWDEDFFLTQSRLIGSLSWDWDRDGVTESLLKSQFPSLCSWRQAVMAWLRNQFAFLLPCPVRHRLTSPYPSLLPLHGEVNGNGLDVSPVLVPAQKLFRRQHTSISLGVLGQALTAPSEGLDRLWKNSFSTIYISLCQNKRFCLHCCTAEVLR